MKTEEDNKGRVCDFKVMNSLDSFFVPNIRAYVVR